ncbi:MAG: tetratricopeptide repeat protein [Phycisphaeraceae bacterium JB051]
MNQTLDNAQNQKLVDQRYALLLITLTLLAYVPVLQCGYIWDDDYYVTHNATLTHVGGLADIWFSPHSIPQYYPMVHTSFWLEYRAWGLHPTGYHVINVLLHIGSCLLLWRLLLKLKMPRYWAWIAAGIFALHPVQVESVAWITERKNVLSCLFYLFAAHLYLRFDQSRHWRHWLLAFGLFVLALLSKTVVLTLPAAMLVILWQQRGRLKFKTDFLPTLPFFAIGICMGLLTAWLEKTHVGAQGHEWGHDAVERFLLAGRVVSFYAGKLLLPMDLSFVYPRWEMASDIWWQWLFPLGVLAVLFGSVVYAVETGKRTIAACLLCFVGTLFPALGFVNVFPFRYSFVADHFQYHASIGFCVLMALLLSRLFKRVRFAAIALLVVYVGLSMMQTLHYTNAESLWRATIKTNPDAWLARNNLALILRQRGEIDQVKALMDEAIRRTPDAIEPRLNMGQLMMELGKPVEAVTHFDVVLAQVPDDRRALFGKAIALEQAGDLPAAAPYFQKTVEVYKAQQRFLHSAQGWMANARSLEGMGHHADALAAYEQGAQAYPTIAAEAYQRMGVIAQKRGQIAAAVKWYAKSAGQKQSASVESINYWAWILSTSPGAGVRNGQRAQQLAIGICKLTGNRAPRYLDTLAAASARAGQFDQAVSVQQHAIDLAIQAGFTQLVKAMQSRLENYQARKPYDDPTLPKFSPDRLAE